MPPDVSSGLSSLLYRSRNLVAPDSGEILRIVDVALRRNRLLGVTGILYFDDQTFIQYIEGLPDGVRSLLGALEEDPRHRIEWVHPLPGPEMLRYAGGDMAFYDGRRPDRCPAARALGDSTRETSPDAVCDLLFQLPCKRPSLQPPTGARPGAMG